MRTVVCHDQCMGITTRQRPNGTIELRVTHAALPKPYYTTHNTDAEAKSYGSRLVQSLDRGDVPVELRASNAKETNLAVMLKAYLDAAPISTTDRPMVEWLRKTLNMKVEGVTVLWVDGWVRSMKRLERLAPGTIRKRVESLARALDWWYRKEYDKDDAPSNPLRTLPRGYSTYGEEDGPVRVDLKRDRRLFPDEPEKIEAAILGEKRTDRQRPLSIEDAQSFLLFWRLIVNTGLRQREAYKLRHADVRFSLKTIHVPAGKTGRARDVPMTRYVHDLLRDGQAIGPLVFPFWDGDENSLDRTSNKLSNQFLRVFEYAGCDGLTEHDLRHEATCRWMLMTDGQGRWMFRPEEVRRITGHISVQVFERYLSLRGSDLAERLW